MAKRATSKKKEESPLLSALRFVSVAQAETGEPYKTHCRFINGYVVAFDGVLAAGHPAADVEANICPHTYRLINALEKATGAFSLSVLDTLQINIKTDKFRALVPAVSPDLIQFVGPDPYGWPLNDDFKTAADIATMFTTEGATVVAYAAGLTRDGSIVGTNGLVFIEARHGNPTPPGLIIPKQFFAALSKIGKKIVGFGFSQYSFTVWFDDNSWLRTQLYVNEVFPSLDLVFAWADTARPTEIPKGMFDAIKAVTPFNEFGSIYFGEGEVRSHPTDDQGASHVVKGVLPTFGAYTAKHLLALEGIAHKFDFTGNERAAIFYNETNSVRGAIAKRT